MTHNDYHYEKLGQILVFSRGFDVTKKEQTEGNYPVVSSSGVTSWNNQFKCHAPGVVTGRKGTLGKVFYINRNYWPHDTTLWVKDFKGNEPRYIYYLLAQLRLDVFDAGASNPTLNRNHLHRIQVPFIKNIEIQKRIASILGAYDDLIEINNQRIKLLEETARELYKEWFVRMRFPGYRITKFVKGIPEGWEVSTCYSFATISGGGTPSTTNPVYWNGGIKFFTPTDFCNSIFVMETEKEISKKGLENSSTKVFSKYTSFVTARGSVGNISLAAEEMAMNQSCFGLTARRSDDTFYLFLFLQNMVGYLKAVATGATFDAITLKTFQDHKQPIPSEDIRKRFDVIVRPLFLLLENLIRQNADLRQIRDRLLPRLISGKLQLKETKEAKVVSITESPASMVAEKEALYKKRAK